MDLWVEEAFASASSILAGKGTILRGKSGQILPTLLTESLDIIYLDGSHYYEEVKADLKEAKRLLRPGGLLCGDDYEVSPTEEFLSAARLATKLDYFTFRGKDFHPGVLLAVNEELGEVSHENGIFWWTP
jgi:predicted O-methyltransferase YrrM